MKSIIMILLILFAFLAGLVTILSPCILPVLPIVLAGSAGEGKQKPLGIVTGFVVSFTFLTLFLATAVQYTGLSADLLRFFAVLIIFILGLSLLFPKTQVFLEKIFSQIANFVPQQQQGEGFISGVAVGLSLGVLWAPCVGPILASVITLAVTTTVNLSAVLITFSYAVGTAIPMLAITYGGRQLLTKNIWLLKNAASIQKFFGIVMMATAVALFFNADRRVQTYLLEKFPQYGSGLTSLENTAAVQKELQKFKTGSAVSVPKLQREGTKAADFVGGTQWLNTTQPLLLSKELKGKVVLVDFWTYSCINCIRTFPYLRKWYDTYKEKDFVIIGVHSPEFAFEKETKNVERAVKDFGLTYPIVQDNNFAIWQAYDNQYWPAHYLIDKNGNIRYVHFGEGKYVETENAIRLLLDEEPIQEGEDLSVLQRRPQTPETYLGLKRAASYIYENAIVLDKQKNYTFSGELPEDGVGLKGEWRVEEEKIVSHQAGATLHINFLAQKVHLVMSPGISQSTKKVKILLDGKALPEKYFTADFNAQGEIEVRQAKKYDLLDLKNEYGRHDLEIICEDGVEVFAFTFGS